MIDSVIDAMPQWVGDASILPVAFAQVREDPLLDGWVAEQLGEGGSILMVASGGCTAAYLATVPNLARIHLVDPNPAQIALARLKLRLLLTASPQVRRELLGHAPVDAEERQRRLTAELDALGLPPDALGPAEVNGRDGPDHTGRYERAFAALRENLRDVRGEIDALLRLSDPGEQLRRVAEDTPLGRRLDEAFDAVLSLPILVQLFGAEATNNRVEPFGRHFARRLRHALGTLPAVDNPYVWQMLAGTYPDGHAVPWLDAPTPATPPARMPPVTWSVGRMAEALVAEPGGYDFVHLSNILDWLSPDAARAMLERTWDALRPGGWTLIRQLNSTLDIPALGGRFDWLPAEAARLHARDRSFFYRVLHLGRKR